ncbi:MAG: hypothetical protein ACQEQV_03445 [Fibrobacterota bacterium]
MQNIVLVTAAPAMEARLTAGLNRSGEWNVTVAPHLRGALRILLKNEIHTVLVDLQTPVKGTGELLTVLKHRFPRVYRVLLRATEYHPLDRPLLELGHSSFPHPRSSAEIRTFSERLKILCPSPSRGSTARTEKESTDLSEYSRTNDTHDLTGLSNYIASESCDLKILTERMHAHTALVEKVYTRLHSPAVAFRGTAKSLYHAVKLMGLREVHAIIREEISRRNSALNVA